MIFLKQSTASQEIPLGYFLDSTDGDTEETALTIANTDIKLWKTGATTLANKNSGGATHISNGIYYAVLDATDTNTLGPMTIFVHPTGALACKVECCVLAANVYDSLIAASDKLEVDTTLVEGIDATDQINAACDTALVDYDAVVPADLPTNFADLAIAVTTGRVTAGTVIDKTGYSISGTKTTLDALNDISAAAVNTEVDTALTDYDAPTKTELDAGFAALNDPTAAAISDAVWDEALAGHAISGSTGEALSAAGGAGDPWITTLPGSYTGSQAGKMLSDILTDTTEIGAAGAGLTEAGGTGDHLTAVPWNATWDAEVQSECTDALNAYDPPTNAELSAAVAPLATAASVTTVDTVVDGIQADLSNATDGLGALKALLDTIAGYLDTEIAAILADTGTTLDGKLNTIDTVVDAIKVVTDQMVFTKTNELDVNTKSINDATVVGDGNATPWDGA